MGWFGCPFNSHIVADNLRVCSKTTDAVTNPKWMQYSS